MDLSVIIPTYNRAHLLRDTLTALFNQQVSQSLDWEIIVVDNNSTDPTRAVVDSLSRSAPVDLEYLFEPRQGLNHARNAGIQRARGTAIAFTDDDVLPAPDWVAQSATAIRRWRADGVGGQILPLWASPPPDWLQASQRLRTWLALMEFQGVRRLTYPPRGIPQVWGANMVFARHLFEKVGTFHTARGPRAAKLYRGDETEFINRALRLGHTVVYDPALRVFHRIGPERMTRRYFRRYAFDTAEGEALLELNPTGRLLFGAPRWQYQLAIRALIKWLLAPNRLHRFERQLDLLSELGRLCGYWKNAHHRRSSAPQTP